MAPTARDNDINKRAGAVPAVSLSLADDGSLSSTTYSSNPNRLRPCESVYGRGISPHIVPVNDFNNITGLLYQAILRVRHQNN